LGRPYTYYLRPAYGSDELLLEFVLDSNDIEFNKDLFWTLKDIYPKVESVEDYFLNDAVLFKVSSNEGEFSLSKDIWGFAFLRAEKNQECIKKIDSILKESNFFLKEEVDFAKYKNVQK
jgi:hypothetical protein